ncbi:MAG: hypothetical protein ACHREM_00590 [Polyangiales bacterium]
MKLHHVLAVESGIKNKTTDVLTAIYKLFQKPDFFNGHMKTFAPRSENQDSSMYEQLPDDRKNVQQNVAAMLGTIRDKQTELFDLSFKRDTTNCIAKSDIAVDGVVILKDVTVLYLLWLGHQLDNLHSEVSKIPTLDPAEKWTFDAQQNLWATEPTKQIRTKKMEVPLVLAPSTPQHAAQVKTITEDVRTGDWTTIKYSSAMPVDQRDAILSRVEKLQNAVKHARETANSTDVPADLPSAGKAIFDFVLAK